MHAHRTIVIGTVLAAGGFVAGDLAAAHPTTPGAVKKAARKIFPKQRLSFEKDNGLYETKTKTDLEVSFDSKGKIAEVEFLVPMGLVPRKVLATAHAHLPSGKRYVEAEIHVRTGAVVYELECPLPGGKELEVYIDARGKLLKTKRE